jgi:hypothetical protein
MIDLIALMLNAILLVPKLQLGNEIIFEPLVRSDDESGTSKTPGIPKPELGNEGMQSW